MAAQAAGFLVQAGKLPALADPVWDTSAWLPQHSVFGQVLHALIGYSERPSGMQLVFFVAVVVVLGVAMRMINRPTARNTTGSAAHVVSAAVVLVTMVIPARAHAAHVVHSPIVEEGEFAIEYRGHHDFDGSNDVDGGEQHKLELEYAPESALADRGAGRMGAGAGRRSRGDRDRLGKHFPAHGAGTALGRFRAC